MVKPSGSGFEVDDFGLGPPSCSPALGFGLYAC
jgi:hypothetical protein